ncbi:DUF1289 domain-containing protein [Vibrio sp. YMD68]|uniref:DUF1289 domain-containing protein n=1 Tax=Vibrio sp. YMD68 TaxID=3042300 RepID=UPI00249CBD6C|nr:DUF1289 domain-containing protein [Vibrio sp. YMD68]WGV98769.1 DUF1289 domain-containing protein [Vibrio sp. YMD68]
MDSNNYSNNQSNQRAEIASPCTRNCCLNEKDLCLGCYRTLQEILDWSSMTSEQKVYVKQQCELRKPTGN